MSYEPEITRLFTREGNRFIDIGAHFGEWTEIMNKYYKQSVLFEPNPESYRILSDRFGFRPKGETTINEVALSDKIGGAILRVPEESPAGSQLLSGLTSLLEPHPLYSIPKTYDVEVECRTLDSYDFKLDDKDLVKIDTEGSELNIIRGGLNTLRSCRLSIEVHVEADMPEMVRLLGNTTQTIFYTAAMFGKGQYYIVRTCK